jgi:hypothetical protein
MNREDAKNAKEERRMRELGEQVEQLAYRAIGAAIEVHRNFGTRIFRISVSGILRSGIWDARDTLSP